MTIFQIRFEIFARAYGLPLDLKILKILLKIEKKWAKFDPRRPILPSARGMDRPCYRSLPGDCVQLALRALFNQLSGCPFSSSFFLLFLLFFFSSSSSFLFPSFSFSLFFLLLLFLQGLGFRV